MREISTGLGVQAKASILAARPEPLGVLADEKSRAPHLVNGFVEAVNQGDTKAFLAFFLKDGVVIDSGRRFAGHDAILGWSDQEFIGAYGHMTVKKVEQRKNVVTVKADWKSTYYSGPSSFEFVGERIQELRIKGE